MRHLSVSLLILGLACDLAAAQRPDTAAVSQGFVAAPRASRSANREAKREAEQRRRRVDYLDAGTLNPLAPFEGKAPALWGTTLLTSGDEQTLYVLVRRTVSSVPEVHARWDDIVTIRSGNGVIELGDSLVGSKYRAPGERMGGTITNWRQIVVHPGDLVRIPAAVPHAFVVSGSEPLQYLVIKHRRQELPIRWYGDK
jgi:mannose-6-phosphate isomerase-like protein (cupin superfamily)